MRRRTFLTTLGTSAGAGIYTVSGCTARRSAVTRSSTLHPPAPPSSTAIPIDFGTEQIWPPPEVADPQDDADSFRVHCARGHHLIVDIDTRYLPQDLKLTGRCPAVVDLVNLKVYAICPDNTTNGYHTTVAVLAKPPDNKTATPLSNTGVAELVIGPSILDDEHAYIVIDHLPQEASQNSTASTSKSMLKLRLSDCSVVTTTILREHGITTDHQEDDSTTSSARRERDSYADLVSMYYESNDFPRGSIAFTTDNAALMITDGFDPYTALRVSATDLTIEFDAHSVLTGFYRDHLHAEAVCTTDNAKEYYYSRATVVTLADGVSHRMAEGDIPDFVAGRWIYCRRMGGYDGPTVMINLDTGEEVWPEDYLDDVDRFLMVSDGYLVVSSGYSVNVRRPGAASPTITLTKSSGFPTKAGFVYNSTLYAISHESEVRVFNVDTHQQIGSVRLGSSALWPRINAVTPFGISDGSRFLPATKWLSEHSTTSGPIQTPTSTSEPTP